MVFPCVCITDPVIVTGMIVLICCSRVCIFFEGLGVRDEGRGIFR
jgi:hypothetical protein